MLDFSSFQLWAEGHVFNTLYYDSLGLHAEKYKVIQNHVRKIPTGQSHESWKHCYQTYGDRDPVNARGFMSTLPSVAKLLGNIVISRGIYFHHARVDFRFPGSPGTQN